MAFREQMRILVTNDDGIYSDGLWSLVEALKDVGEVCVAAPDRDRSGIGTAMTLLDVVRAEKVRASVDGVEAYAVQGTPGDCVILAYGALFDAPFDIIFSGINQGANMGEDVLLSGTVGAALHGYLRRIPSVAVSSYYDYAAEEPIRYAVACTAAASIARDLDEDPVSAPLLLNVNTPDADPGEVEGVEITVPGRRAFNDSVERERVGRRSYYWIRLKRSKEYSGGDAQAVWNKRVSISSIEPLPNEGVSPERLERLAQAVRRGIEASGGLAGA